MPLTLKIGGCEAVKDLYEAASWGEIHRGADDRIDHALQKFCDTIPKVYPAEEAAEVDFLFNVEPSRP